ncbi:hypothetical protein SAMN03159453_05117 [Pseudomonas sp. NFIX28]|nr:hypothetical protein SAMN03159453_05117 [Pseudomonas sp. NFIX28]
MNSSRRPQPPHPCSRCRRLRSSRRLATNLRAPKPLRALSQPAAAATGRCSSMGMQCGHDSRDKADFLSYPATGIPCSRCRRLRSSRRLATNTRSLKPLRALSQPAAAATGWCSSMGMRCGNDSRDKATISFRTQPSASPCSRCRRLRSSRRLATNLRPPKPLRGLSQPAAAATDRCSFVGMRCGNDSRNKATISFHTQPQASPVAAAEGCDRAAGSPRTQDR